MINKKENHIFGIKGILTLLHISGGWPYINSGILYKLFQGLVYVFLGFISVSEGIFAYVHFDDLKVSLNGIMILFACVKGLLQLTFIIINNKRIHHIFDSFSNAYNKFGLHCEKEKEEEIYLVNMNLRKQFRTYLSICITTASLWASVGFMDPVTDSDHKLQGIEIPDFPFKYGFLFWVPFIIRTKTQFYVILVIITFDIYWMTWIYVSIDCLRVSLFRYLLGHLHILEKEIEKSDSCGKHSMKKILTRCVLYHDELIRIAKEIEIVTRYDLFAQCFIFIIVFALCGAASSETFDTSVMKIYLLGLVVLTQIFMVMSAGDDIFHEDIAISVYNCPWVGKPKEVQFIVYLMIRRSIKTKSLFATPFIPITNTTFTALLNSAFTYITLINNVNS